MHKRIKQSRRKHSSSKTHDVILQGRTWLRSKIGKLMKKYQAFFSNIFRLCLIIRCKQKNPYRRYEQIWSRVWHVSWRSRWRGRKLRNIVGCGIFSHRLSYLTHLLWKLNQQTTRDTIRDTCYRCTGLINRMLLSLAEDTRASRI